MERSSFLIGAAVVGIIWLCEPYWVRFREQEKEIRLRKWQEIRRTVTGGYEWKGECEEGTG